MNKKFEIPELPDDFEKSQRGKMAGKRGEGFAEIFEGKQSKAELEAQQKEPKTLEEAVRVVREEDGIERVLAYLEKHPDEVTEFCLQLFERYQKDKTALERIDKTGVVELALILKQLLVKRSKISP